MKFWFKLFFITLAFLVLIAVSGYVFLALQGRAIISRYLQERTGRQVSIGKFYLGFPLNFQIDDLNVEGLAQAKRVSASLSALHLMAGNIGFNRIVVIEPVITYERKAASEEGDKTSRQKKPAVKEPLESIKVPAQLMEKIFGSIKPQARPIKAKDSPPRLVLRDFRIRDGRLTFVDQKAGISLKAEEVDFDLNNLCLIPASAITNFDLKARLPWREGGDEGSLEFRGWMNLFKRDMQADLRIENIDGVYLYPYYAQWIDLDKARIEKAKLKFSSNIHGLNNDVNAHCRVELTDIVRKAPPEEGRDDESAKLTDAVLNIFRILNQGNIIFDFTFKTKMDQPEFGFGYIKTAFDRNIARGINAQSFKAQDVFALPGRIIEGVVRSAAEVSTAMIDGTFAVGNEIKNALEASFRKD